MKHLSKLPLLALLAAMLLGTAASCGRIHKTPSGGAGGGGAAVSAVMGDKGIDGRDARPTDKITSMPPTGPVNKVSDLTATRETNGDFTLSWHYRNIGDYDQDGAVGVSDITPLAMHFGETYDAASVPDCIQAVIDGSGNEKIGVEDVTQIAMNFGANVAQYSVQGADQQQGSFTHTSYMLLPDEGRSDGRIALTINLGSQPAYTYWRVVPEDAEGNPGEASNIVALNVEAPVRVLGVTPLSGLAGAEVTFTAFVAGTGPFTYEWDFGGGTTPNTSTAAQPIVTLNNDAVDTEYAAQVKVTGASGSATRYFTLTVTTLPGNPPVINSVGPFAGLSGDAMNFSADVTGDEPLTYSWEFDGGASPPVSSEANPTAILSRGGTLPSPDVQYACRLTVTNPSGASSADFTLTVSARWHEQAIPLVPGYSDLHLGSYQFAPDGSLWGKQIYVVASEYKAFLVHITNGVLIDYEEIPGLLAIDVDSDGNIGCVNYEMSGLVTYDLFYSQRTGSTWQNRELVAGGLLLSSNYLQPLLRYDSEDNPAVVFVKSADQSHSDLLAAKRINQSWSLSSVSEGSYIQNYLAEYDPDDDLCVAFLTWSSVDGQDMFFADESQSTWNAEMLGDGFETPEGARYFGLLGYKTWTNSGPIILFNQLDYSTSSGMWAISDHIATRMGSTWSDEVVTHEEATTRDNLTSYTSDLLCTGGDELVVGRNLYENGRFELWMKPGSGWERKQDNLWSLPYSFELTSSPANDPTLLTNITFAIYW